MSVQNIDNAIIGIVTGEISFSLMILLKPRSYFVCRVRKYFRSINLIWMWTISIFSLTLYISTSI